MRKVMSLMMVLLALLALTGCRNASNENGADGATVDPAQTVSDVMNDFLTQYQDQMPAFIEVDAQTLEAVYGIPAEWVDAYACRMPMMNVHATEIFVAHVAEGHMEEVEQAVQARQQALETTWGRYLPAQLELVQASVTEVRDQYILYAVTEHADGIREIFEKNVTR